MIERTALVGIAAALAFVPGEVAARVQEYQIVRLLTFQSSCQVEHLDERSMASGPLLYFATCQNTTFYPDGVEVACSVRDDERTCTILTPVRRFNNLDLLQR